MKRILTTLCALAFAIAGCTSAPTTENASTPCYKPTSTVGYTYGDFDESRIDMTYQLSLSDNPNLIPTEDFERAGRRYFLLDFTREETDAECGMVTYTVTFGSEKLPYGVKTFGGTRSKAEVYADPVGQKSMLIVIVVMLVLAAAAMIESKNQADHPVESDDEDDFFAPLYEARKKSN